MGRAAGEQGRISIGDTPQRAHIAASGRHFPSRYARKYQSPRCGGARLKILITNADLDLYAGTQVVVRDLAVQLQRQGHQPMAYSRKLGDVADEIRSHGIEVTDNLNRLSSVPDVIHGQYHPLVIETLLQFPSVPAILVCHAARGFSQAPVYFPRILRYVGIDCRCRSRLESLSEIPKQLVDVIFNAVDLERFRPRSRLPVTPERAAIFSNNASR